MFIDCHIHVLETYSCPRPVTGEPGLDIAENQVKLLEQNNIEKAVILPIGSPDSTCFVQSNEEALRIAATYPDKYIPFCNIDPRSLFNTPNANLEYVLKYYRDKGCKGIGEVTAHLQLDDPRVENLFSAAQSAGIPLTFHLAPQEGGFYGLIEPEPGLKKLERALQKFPNLKFFGHSQVFWGEMAANMSDEGRRGYPKGKITEEGAVPTLMRKYPNLYGDLSAGSGSNALMRDEEYAVKFLNEFQDRLMFGTDYCAPSSAGLLSKLGDFLLKLRDEKKISEEVFQKVAKGNITRLLGL